MLRMILALMGCLDAVILKKRHHSSRTWGMTEFRVITFVHAVHFPRWEILCRRGRESSSRVMRSFRISAAEWIHPHVRSFSHINLKRAYTLICLTFDKSRRIRPLVILLARFVLLCFLKLNEILRSSRRAILSLRKTEIHRLRWEPLKPGGHYEKV